MNHLIPVAAVLGFITLLTFSSLALSSFSSVSPPSTNQDWRIRTIRAVLLGEARSEGPAGINAVAETIRNRMERTGKSAYVTATQRKQFSCLNGHTPEAFVVIAEEWTQIPPNTEQAASRNARLLVFDPFSNLIGDATKGATHFHDASAIPYWAEAKRKTVTIGNFTFYRF